MPGEFFLLLNRIRKGGAFLLFVKNVRVGKTDVGNLFGYGCIMDRAKKEQAKEFLEHK